MAEYRVVMIPRKEIVWPAQERKHFDPESLAELAATIRAHGILEPIGVYKQGNGYCGLWGQRRWMGAEIAGLELVPTVIVDKPARDADAMEIRLIENLAREALRPLEQASALAGLIKTSGLLPTEIAKRVGLKPAAVSKSLALLQLPDSIQQKLDAGLISPAAGYELSRVEDPALRLELAEQVARGALGRDALAGKIKSSKQIHKPTAAVKRYLMIAAAFVLVRGYNLASQQRSRAVELNDSVIEQQMIAARFREMQGEQIL